MQAAGWWEARVSTPPGGSWVGFLWLLAFLASLRLSGWPSGLEGWYPEASIYSLSTVPELELKEF